MSANGQSVIQILEKWVPKSLAEPEDRIGLQLGTLNKPVHKVLIALDVSEDVVAEAIEHKVDLIIAHHAIIYRPLKDLRTDSSAGRVYEQCLKHDIAVYITHTNLDVAPGGINDMMADALGLQQRTFIKEVVEDKLCKVVVYVPEDHKESVCQAMFSAGAGAIGEYSHCSFQSEGTGTFLPGVGTDPHIGKIGQLERVREIKVETIVPESLLRKVTAAMIKSHPYEEPAYDVVQLKQPGIKHGLGRVGAMPESMSLTELCAKVKQVFDVPMLRVVGRPDQIIRKAAVLGGAGGKFVRSAQFAGADVLITGDIDYHTAQDALADGFALIDPGHNVEKIMKQGVADVLSRDLASAKLDVEVLASKVNTEPFRFE